MPLLNYTSDVSVDQTLGEIGAKLRRAGAKSVQVEYGDDIEPIAVSFVFKTEIGIRGYRLPANPQGVWAVFLADQKSGEMKTQFCNRGQANRTAWRIVKDWLEAQLALVQSKQATVDQVMFPYMLSNVDKELTVFEEYRIQMVRLNAGKENSRDEDE